MKGSFLNLSRLTDRWPLSGHPIIFISTGNSVTAAWIHFSWFDLQTDGKFNISLIQEENKVAILSKNKNPIVETTGGKPKPTAYEKNFSV
jgi:hypothetical protein